MNKILESKILTLLALLIVVAVVVLTFVLKMPVLSLIPCFFAFMMVFCHLASLLIKKMNPVASRTIDKCALVSGIFTVIAIITVYFLIEY